MYIVLPSCYYKGRFELMQVNSFFLSTCLSTFYPLILYSCKYIYMHVYSWLLNSSFFVCAYIWTMYIHARAITGLNGHKKFWHPENTVCKFAWCGHNALPWLISEAWCNWYIQTVHELFVQQFLIHQYCACKRDIGCV